MVEIVQADVIIITVCFLPQEQTRLEEDKVEWWHRQESTHVKATKQMHLPVPYTFVLSFGWSWYWRYSYLLFQNLLDPEWEKERSAEWELCAELQAGTVVFYSPRRDAHSRPCQLCVSVTLCSAGVLRVTPVSPVPKSQHSWEHWEALGSSPQGHFCSLTAWVTQGSMQPSSAGLGAPD